MGNQEHRTKVLSSRYAKIVFCGFRTKNNNYAEGELEVPSEFLTTLGLSNQPFPQI